MSTYNRVTLNAYKHIRIEIIMHWATCYLIRLYNVGLVPYATCHRFITYNIK